MLPVSAFHYHTSPACIGHLLTLTAMPHSHLDYTIKTLRFLAFSGRPVLIEEVAELIAVDLRVRGHFDPDLKLNDVYDIMMLCSGLVTISTSYLSRSRVSKIYGISALASRKGIVARTQEEGLVSVHELKLAHFSVKEWLVSTHTSESIPVLSGFAEYANDIIARTCLAYIYYVNSFPTRIDLRIEDVPFINYATDYCFHHMRLCDAVEYSPQLQCLSLELLNINVAQRINLSQLTGQRLESDVCLDDVSSCSLLYCACLCGVYRLTELLLAHGANINEYGGPYVYALNAAIAGNHMEVVALLLRNGANVNSYVNYACVGHFEYSEYVRNCRFSGSPLQWAVYLRSETAIPIILLDAGADINIQGISDSVLHTACATPNYGRVNIVQLLLQTGADPNLRGGAHDTVLHTAALRKDPMTFELDTRLINLLLKYGAQRNVRDRHGWTALQCAQAHESFVVCQLLRLDEMSESQSLHDIGYAPQDMICTNREFARSGTGIFTVTGMAWKCGQ